MGVGVMRPQTTEEAVAVFRAAWREFVATLAGSLLGWLRKAGGFILWK